MERFYHAEALW